RDEVAERAALVAERHAAVHATPGLSAQHLLVVRVARAVLVHLAPVHEPHGHRTVRRELALADLEKTTRISHEPPPGCSPRRPGRPGRARRTRPSRGRHAP